MWRIATVLVLSSASLLLSHPINDGHGHSSGDASENSRIPDDADAFVRTARQAEVTLAWPDAVVPIAFAPDYPDSQKASAYAGMDAWEKVTCVRFTRGDTTSANRAVIVNAGSCQSSVGRVGGVQTVKLGPGCNGVASSAHELGHLLGLQHQATRSDRNRSIFVDEGNVHPSMYILNFNIQPLAQSFGLSYDFTSIMQYQPMDFAWNKNRPVLVPLTPHERFHWVMGNYLPSFYDSLLVNKMYRCDEKCTSFSTQCYNGGYKNPNSCNQCICPRAWGGPLCNQNPSGSQALTASTSQQTVEVTVGNPQDDQRDNYDIKDFVITAPSNRNVSLSISYVWSGDSGVGCKMGGLEIFAMKDSRMDGVRVCRPDEVEPLYTSEGSRMYVRLYGRFSQTQATFWYWSS